MINPQEAYNILFRNGYTGKLKSAVDIGNKYLFVFISINQEKDKVPITGRFRTAIDKHDRSISLYDMLSNENTTQMDVTDNITTFYDKRLGNK